MKEKAKPWFCPKGLLYVCIHGVGFRFEDLVHRNYGETKKQKQEHATEAYVIRVKYRELFR